MTEKEQLKNKLGELIDPSNEKTLAENDAIRHLAIDGKTVTVLIGIADEHNDEAKKTLRRNLAKTIKRDLGYEGLKLDFEPLKKKDSILQKKNIHYIGVASGKGGVGKSTVAANLALALKRLGKKVGIIDADIYGSNMPIIMDMEIRPPKANEKEKIIPFNKHGIELISTEFFMEEGKPLMWRGPMLSKMLEHFFYDVDWDEETEYVIIDLPPGTGDVAIDIQRFIPECRMLIVTTPHPSASRVAVKAGFAARQLKHSILGVIENMSYLKQGDEVLRIFGEGGGKEVADKLDTALVQQIPIGQPESGHHSLFGVKEELGVLYLGLANKLIKTVEKDSTQ